MPAGEYQAPHPDTVCRVLKRLHPAEMDAAYAHCRAAQLADLYDTEVGELVAVAVDGKSQRGTAAGEHRARHRLGAMLAEEALTLAQPDVDGKSNEIIAFIPLLDQMPRLTNMVISADMMQTQREHARYLHRRGAYFVLPVGGNWSRSGAPRGGAYVVDRQLVDAATPSEDEGVFLHVDRAELQRQIREQNDC